MDAITRGLGDDSATAQEEAEAREQRPRKVWCANIGVIDLFPANERELDQMRKLWPLALGPRLPEEIGVPRLTECCQAGTVGWIREWKEPGWFGGYVQRRVGRKVCFFCGKLVGEY